MQRKAVIVGAGPVGCLTAIALAKQGWQVVVYEGRPDMRMPSAKAFAQQRSINLAISSRGIAALESIDPESALQFLKTAIPMRGRMIHLKNGKLNSQLYDKDGQCINSIDRALLNETLLDEVEKNPDISIHFQHKVESVDFDNWTLVARDLERNEPIAVAFDLCVGADGSYSVVRRQMMRVVRMDFQQEYIPHEYIELRMPAGLEANGRPKFLIDSDHLHIWPRHSFMLIALPNKDYTFTCTLFAPKEEFDRLISPEEFLSWFRIQFPDALALIGEKNLLKDFTRNPRSPLICTKSRPYHYKDRAILLGDAAHSMVPFYGQGLNCGLEDVRILDALFRQERVQGSTVECKDKNSEQTDPRLARALARYSEGRHEDLVAICDLATENYLEMRHAVTTPGFILRKLLDTYLYSITSKFYFTPLGRLSPNDIFLTTNPQGWLPLYTMITFRPDISYNTAKSKAAQQAKWVTNTALTSLTLTGVAAAWASWKLLTRR